MRATTAGTAFCATCTGSPSASAPSFPASRSCCSGTAWDRCSRSASRNCTARSCAGLILSGSFGSAPNIGAGIAAARAVRLLRGDRAPSPLQRAMFADFNKAVCAARPGFEWLSRDDDEVRKYADDPHCGFTFSNRSMLDMLCGYVETWKPENERRLPTALPVLLFSGAARSGRTQHARRSRSSPNATATSDSRTSRWSSTPARATRCSTRRTATRSCATSPCGSSARF